MDFVWYFVLLAVLVLGLFLTLIGSPGNWLMALATAAYAYLTWPRVVGWPLLAVVGVLAILGEVLQNRHQSAGLRRAQASRRAAWGAMIGGFLGGIFLTFLVPVPILGTIVGVCAGTFIGALLFESAAGRELGGATRVGFGAAGGTLAGIISKIGVGIVIFLTAGLATFPISCGTHRPTPATHPTRR